MNQQASLSGEAASFDRRGSTPSVRGLEDLTPPASPVLANIAFVVVGPPGSGKDTHVARLKQECGGMEISSGDLVRAGRASSDPEIATACAEAKRGKLIPDAMMLALLEPQLEQSKGSPILYLNGFPRNDGQAAILRPLLAKHGFELGRVLHFTCPDDVALERMRARGREDDEKETPEERLALYHGVTEPLLARFERAALVTPFDTTGNKDAVGSAIVNGVIKMIAEFAERGISAG